MKRRNTLLGSVPGVVALGSMILIMLYGLALSKEEANPPFNLDDVLTIEKFQPQGEWYDATVPDTLDLSELAKVSINAQIGNLEPKEFYGVYQGFWFTKTPPNFLKESPGPYALTWNISVKNARTLPTLRVMCGSDQGLEDEFNMMRALLSAVREDGLLYYSFDGQGPPKGTSYPQTNASMMFAILNHYGLDGNPEWLKWIDLMAKGIRKPAVLVEDRAFYPMQAGVDPEGNWHVMNMGAVAPYTAGERPFEYDPLTEPETDAMGYEGAAKAEANRAMAMMAKHYVLMNDQQSLELANRLLRYSMKPGMWAENQEESRYPGYEHGIWKGHFHNGTQALSGMLDMALATNSGWLKQFCREHYANIVRNGVIRMGWFPCWSLPEKSGNHGAELAEMTEPCALADTIVDAVRMSDAGLGDYWDDVDAIVRNHLVEQQMSDLEQMRKVSGAEPGSAEEALLKKFRGGFAACTPTRVNQYSMAGCCTANGPQGYYYAWHGITRFDKGVATVNLFLNRASQWMDIDSYLPYEGKVVLKNKQAHTALVRIPAWVDISNVNSTLEREGAAGEKEVTPVRIENRLLFEELKPGDQLTLTFPVPETTDEYTINGKKYTIEFKGSTVVDISPRDTAGVHYLLYQRDNMKADKAPMMQVKRFAADKIIPLGTF